MIRAVDTNVLVRLITGDDAAQADVARTVLGEDFVLIATVLVETEWVLKSRYRLSRAQRAGALRLIVDLPHAIDVPAHTLWALERMAAGADFADMMHLAGATSASTFATFDQSMAAGAGADTPIAVEALG